MAEKCDKTIGTLSSDGATMAKVIATFCVVLTHSYKIFGYMHLEDRMFYLRGIHAFASCGVPVFFLLSGYFLVLKGKCNWRDNMIKKVKSLMIPYCLFIVFYALISCLGALVLPSFFDNFRQFSLFDWGVHICGIPFFEGPHYYGPLWFVRDLLILNVLSFIIIPISRIVPGYILIPLMLVVYFMPISQLIRYSIPMFVIGVYFGSKKKFPILINPFLVILLLCIGITLPVIVSGTISWMISVFIMGIVILSASELLVQNSIYDTMANKLISYSFPIYLLHEYPVTTLMRLLALWHIPVSFAIFLFLIVPFIIITICIWIVSIWKKGFPKSFAFATGGRY